MARRPDFDPSAPVYDMDGGRIYEWDDDAGQLAASYVQDGEELRLVSYTYRPYSEEEVEQIRAERVDGSVREESIKFFIDGGKVEMDAAAGPRQGAGGGHGPQCHTVRHRGAVH